MLNLAFPSHYILINNQSATDFPQESVIWICQLLSDHYYALLGLNTDCLITFALRFPFLAHLYSLLNGVEIPFGKHSD